MTHAEGSMTVDDIDFSKESKKLFTMFSSNKSLKIDYIVVADFLQKRRIKSNTINIDFTFFLFFVL